jgi:heptosyltransferase II
VKRDLNTPEKIVVFTKNWLGDVIFEEPFIRALKRRFPACTITCITTDRTKEILEANPRIDEVWTFDDRKKDRSLARKFGLYRRIASARFTHGFLLHRSFSRALLFYCARIPFRCGYATKMRRPLLTHALDEPKQALHRVDYLLALLRDFGLYTAAEGAEEYRFYYTESDTRAIKVLLQEQGMESGGFLCMNPGANWPVKRWPPERFAACADMLDASYHIPIVITGSSRDQELASEILQKTQAKRVISLCGKTSIRELGALFARARCVITGDSGPLHIAAGVGTPTIALFGPTSRVETGPRGVGRAYVLQKTPRECRTPCFDYTCKDYRCMQALHADDVYACIKEEAIL